MKTHAQKFVEDLSAPRDRRIGAMQCLSFYGKEGVPILSKVLERESNNFDSVGYAVEALGRIQDRGVMEPMLRLFRNESKGGQHSRTDYLKEKAVEILAELAFTSLEQPNPYRPAIVTKTADIWTITSNFVPEPISIRICGGYYSKGELLRREEIDRIAEVLRKIVESEPEDTTEGEKRVIQAASEGLERIERRIDLLEKYGPKSKKASKSMPK